MSRFLIALFALVGVVSQANAESTAQPKTRQDVSQEAERLFNEGTEQLLGGRAALARDSLRRSLALSWRVPTRYNLGVALRQSGETTEAVATFEGLLQDASLSKEQRQLISTQLRESIAELAVIVVTVTGVRQATVEIDGRVVGDATSKSPLRATLDAGDHVVLARANGSARTRVAVERGKTAEITLHVIPLAEKTAAEQKRRRRRAGWIAGASAIVVGAIVTALAVTRPGQSSEPVTGDTPVLTVRK